MGSLFKLLLVIIIASSCTFKKYPPNAGNIIARNNLERHIKNFVYFGRDREKIQKNSFLKAKNLIGAQIMYSWDELEIEEGIYDFDQIEKDLRFLESKGKSLFIQLQDASFNPEFKPVPNYILSDSVYEGGATYQYDDNGNPEGWVAKRWNAHIQIRFCELILNLGKKFDGRIEGINLQETAIGVNAKYDNSFNPEKYRDAIKKNMLALRKGFSKSATMQYANFMPGEWLPWEDKGYLRSIFAYGEEIGVGIGAPDLMPQKESQLNHAYKFMNKLKLSIPIGIAVQDGNYIGLTNDTSKPLGTWNNLVPSLYKFAKEHLKVSYIFWRPQEPFFEVNVMPFFLASSI